MKPVLVSRTKAMKNYVSSNQEKNSELVIIPTGTNNLEFFRSHEEFLLALFVEELHHQITFSGIVPRGHRFSKKS